METSSATYYSNAPELAMATCRLHPCVSIDVFCMGDYWRDVFCDEVFARMGQCRLYFVRRNDYFIASDRCTYTSRLYVSQHMAMAVVHFSTAALLHRKRCFDRHHYALCGVCIDCKALFTIDEHVIRTKSYAK